MSKIQVESAGRSSASTHRLTQSSTTLNRRYVRRPMNAAVEEAARNAHTARNDAVSTPSRLVNLRVHAADFEAARAAEAKRLAKEEAEAARILAESNQVTLYPNVVEFGMAPAEANTAQPAMSNPEAYTTQPMMSSPAPSATEAEALAAALGTPDNYNGSTAFNPFSNTQSIYNPAGMMSGVPAQSNIPEPSAATNMPAMPESPAAPVDMDALAMNIAADYAAASLGASVKEYGDNYSSYAIASETMPADSSAMTEAPAVATLDASANASVDAIATAASEAIASIRVATDPAQVSEQVASLKAFAENIKTNHDSPEMKELGDTIEKFVNIAMKSTKIQEENAKKANTAVKVSLPAKANRAAAKVTKSSAKVMAASRKKAATPAAKRPATARPMMRSTNNMQRSAMARRNVSRSASPEELKNRAIEQALHSVATMDEEQNRKTKARAAAMPRKRFRARHFAVAFTCAAACVAAIIYVVGSNIPDISVRVAAMQTGIQASYPSYVPRDYSLGDITSENGKITLTFDGPDGASFTLIEEKSSWDSAALLRNYVEPTWDDDYTTTHEQGITIYISDATSNAAWVNGGVLYKITSSSAVLTKKQVRSIVTSL